MVKADDDILKTASQCRHYAMCKIDYLGSGLCPPGKRYHYVSYYPQGRMDLYAALADNLIPTYANDPFPLADMKMPRYVVLPGMRDEVSAVVRLANELGLPYAVRGNG